MSYQHRRVGLALGGGVVRGIAHIGVLAVLEEAGINVDFIAGSSAGALIGAFYCAGVKPAEIKKMAQHLNWFKLMQPTLPIRGFVNFYKMERWLVQELGDLHFSDLKFPFAVAATDMSTGHMVVLKEGRIAPAVRASCSVAGVVTPVEIDGHLLCDGNFTNSVPVDVARAMGADHVIGVDIFTPTIRRRLGAVGYFFAGVEILIQGAGCGIHTADCLVSPDLAGLTYLRFSQTDKLFELGAQATRKKLGDIRNALEFATIDGQNGSSG